MLRFAGDWLPEALDRNDIELKLMRANLPRHSTSVAYMSTRTSCSRRRKLSG
jgi:hypothetical protein